MTRLAHRTATLLAAALIAALGVVGSAAPSSAAIWKVPSPNTSLDPLVNLTEYENRVVHLVNKKRKARDLRPVRYFSSCVDRFSEGWARHLAEIQGLEHRNQRRILRRCDLTWVGETVASGTALAPSGMVRAWMNSRSHRAVLMKPRANRAGMGVRVGADGKIYGVLNFGDVN